jgi:hypothetical protein
MAASLVERIVALILDRRAGGSEGESAASATELMSATLVAPQQIEMEIRNGP